MFERELGDGTMVDLELRPPFAAAGSMRQGKGKADGGRTGKGVKERKTDRSLRWHRRTHLSASGDEDPLLRVGSWATLGGSAREAIALGPGGGSRRVGDSRLQTPDRTPITDPETDDTQVSDRRQSPLRLL